MTTFQNVKLFNNKLVTINNKVSMLPIAWYLAGSIATENCVAAYQPKGATNLTESYTNLANPGTYDAYPGTAPTWDITNGWKFAAANEQYLKTGVVPASGWTWIIKFTNLDITGGVSRDLFGEMSENDYSDFDFCYSKWTNTLYFDIANKRENSSAVAQGIFACAGLQLYKDGVASGSPIVLDANSWTEIAQDIYIAQNNWADSVGGSYGSVYIQALAFYNITLTPTQVLAVTNAMNAL